MVAGSLIITSPYLAQLALAKDVIAATDTQNKKAVTEARVGVERSFDARENEFKVTIASLQKQSIDETAGIGPSKKRGRGSTVATIEARLQDEQMKAAALAIEREQKLAEFDRTPPTELARKYGIRLLGTGIQSRGEVVKQLQQMPGYNSVRIPIYGFLVGIFLAIFALKVFQPRTALIYFSEQLQDAYIAYRAGLYDDLLPAKERSTTGFAMPPVRFEHWWMTSEVIRQRAAAFNDEAAMEGDRQRVTEEAIADMERRVAERLRPRLEERQRVETKVSELEDDEREHEAVVVALKTHVDARRTSLRNLDANLAMAEDEFQTTEDLERLNTLMRIKTKLAKDLLKAETDLGVSQMSLAATKNDLASARGDSERLAKIISEQAAALADAERRRATAHKEHLDQIDVLRRRFRTGL